MFATSLLIEKKRKGTKELIEELMGRVENWLLTALGSAYLFPALSSAGA
jgi:hypothetical protein